jgi:hypothetical protein
MIQRVGLLLLLVASACSQKGGDSGTAQYEPKLTAELLPPAAKGLVLGSATDADVAAAFGAGETKKDKTIGGKIVVQYNDKPAMHLDLAVKDDVVYGEAWFVPDDAGKLRLHRLELQLKTTSTCAWLKTNVGKIEATKRRPGSNRKYGADGRGLEYTAGSPDGTQPVSIECHPTTRDGVEVEVLDYSLETSKGRSMMMNENG